MRKVIKKYGGASVIVLTKEDRICYGLAVGDVVDFFIVEKGVNATPEPEPTKPASLEPQNTKKKE